MNDGYYTIVTVWLLRRSKKDNLGFFLKIMIDSIEICKRMNNDDVGRNRIIF